MQSLTDPNLLPGRLWVENRIRELAQELGRLVDYPEWPRPTDAQYGQMMIAGIVPLKIWRGSEVRIVEFQRTEIVGVEGDPEVQWRASERIRKFW